MFSIDAINKNVSPNSCFGIYKSMCLKQFFLCGLKHFCNNLIRAGHADGATNSHYPMHSCRNCFWISINIPILLKNICCSTAYIHWLSGVPCKKCVCVCVGLPAQTEPFKRPIIDVSVHLSFSLSP